jgi:prepilin-type N-terminal cleavage/methylation domain-containing protein/prepilin-type processing-associated H-X9-DG protein
MKRLPHEFRAREFRRGFTLIEILVVVAIIALLISILLPALSRAREQARTTQCLSQLKQMGNGTMMYTADQKSFLPGPCHMLLLIGTSEWEGAGTTDANGNQGSLYARLNMPYYIGRYLGDKRAKNLDAVATCPTGTRIMQKPSQSNAWYYRLTSNYIANTGSSGGGNAFTSAAKYDYTGNGSDLTPKTFNTVGSKPYYPTNPPNYFGYLNVNSTAHLRAVDWQAGSLPKKIDKIKNLSREWAIADLWSWESAPARGTARRCGTWPFDEVSGENSGALARGERVGYPFHMTTTTWSNNLSAATSADKAPETTRVMTGRTNAAYLDGHGASVRPWVGTVNPCFDIAPKDGNCD